MFVKYEKSFKTILNYYYKTLSRTMLSANFNIPRYELDYLAARGLIEIVQYVNGDPNCRIAITDKGLIYFDEKKETLFRFSIPVAISAFSLAASFLALFFS